MKTGGSNCRLKYYDFWFLGKKYIACNLSLGQFYWGAVFLTAICPRSNYVDDKSSERQSSSGAVSRGILSGGNNLEAITKEASIHGAIFLGGNYSGGNCLVVNYLVGKFPRGQLCGGNNPGGQFSLGAIVLEPWNLKKYHWKSY